MRTSLNINQLQGRLVADPEYKELKNDKKLLTFRFAYDTVQTTDPEGSHSNFISVEAWDKIAEIFSPLLCKGLEVLVSGSLVHQRWKDKEGSPQSRYKFVAQSLNITDMKFNRAA